MESKKAIEVLVLVFLVMFGMVYAHISFLVGPLRTERDQLQAKIKAAQESLAADGPESRKLLNEEQTEAQKVPEDDLLQRVLATSPRVPLVECPSLLTKLLAQHGIMGVKVSLRGYLPLPGFAQAGIQTWGFQGPANPIAVGKMLADLENQRPLAQVSEILLQRSKLDGELTANVSIQFAIIK